MIILHPHPFYLDAGLPLAQLNYSGFWTCIHSASAYTICIITIIHVALHWMLIFNCINIPYSQERRYAIGVGVGVLSGAFIALLGANAHDSITSISKIYKLLNEQSGASFHNAPDTDSIVDESSNPIDKSNEESDEGGSSSDNSSKNATSNDSNNQLDDLQPQTEAPEPGEAFPYSENPEESLESDGICPL